MKASNDREDFVVLGEGVIGVGRDSVKRGLELTSSMGAKARELVAKECARVWAVGGVLVHHGGDKFVAGFIVNNVEGGKGGCEKCM